MPEHPGFPEESGIELYGGSILVHDHGVREQADVKHLLQGPILLKNFYCLF